MKNLILFLLAMLGLNGCMNAQNNSQYTNMDVEQFANYIANDSVQLVDVRTPEEYAGGHIENSKNIDVYNPDFIDVATKTLDKSRPVAVYCRSGKRSADAAQKLTDKGYEVTNLMGGIIAWTDNNKPTQK